MRPLNDPDGPWMSPPHLRGNAQQPPAYGGPPDGPDPTTVDLRPPDDPRSKKQRQRELEREDKRRRRLHPLDGRWRVTVHGSGRDQILHADRVEHARETQLVAVAVLPGASLVAENGQRLVAGDEVRTGSAVDVDAGRADILADDVGYLRQCGVLHVLEQAELARRLGPDDATHAVAVDQLAVPERGQLLRGWRVGPSDYEIADVPPKPERREWVPIARFGLHGPGEIEVRQPAQPGRPGRRGRDALAALERDGKVERLRPSLAQRAAGFLGARPKRKAEPEPEPVEPEGDGDDRDGDGDGDGPAAA